MEIHPVRPQEHAAWLTLRQLLWPDATIEELAEEQALLLSDPGRNTILVAAQPTGELIGFIEVSLREWADGCSTHPVGYIEGWFVAVSQRRSGAGRKLAEAAESWALSKGCSEMGSDAELWNDVSQQAHRALGYVEATRVVCFSKKLR
jgi:aminoglycoside 6'-N-acetyltransferase I